jgi:putative peptide zinc metalloprotease protein
MKQRALVFIAAALIAGGFSAAKPAFARADNAAVSVNTKDGATVFKVAFAIRHVMGDVVDETNAAVAYNSCSDCASVAIAFEIVLVEGDPSVFEPQNIAIAFNENCSTCVAVAEAYQFVLGGGGVGPLHFDSDGNKILAEIRKELHSLKKEDLTIEQLQARLDAIAARIRDVLANHLVAAGPRKPTKSTTATGTTTEPGATATTEPAPTATTEPAPTATTEPAATTTTEPATTTQPATTEPTTTQEATTAPTTTTGVMTTTGP